MQDLMQSLKDKCIKLHNAEGIEAVDHYLDTHHRLIPWEMCYDCDKVTPRDPFSLKCFFTKEIHEQK